MTGPNITKSTKIRRVRVPVDDLTPDEFEQLDQAGAFDGVDLDDPSITFRVQRQIESAESISDRTERRHRARIRNALREAGAWEYWRRDEPVPDRIVREVHDQFADGGAYYVKKCETCGKKFEAKTSRRRFCDDICRVNSHRTAGGKCVICSKPTARANALYCGDSCKAVARRRRSRTS
jgi:hypothetical protein